MQEQNFYFDKKQYGTALMYMMSANLNLIKDVVKSEAYTKRVFDT